MPSTLRALLTALPLIALSACAGHSTPKATPPAAGIEAPGRHDNLNATLWMQRSAEYAATTRGLFELARLRLDAAIADPTWTAAPVEQPNPGDATGLAIIVDADETVVDNSPYQARSVIFDRAYASESWYAWCRELGAAAVPGARAFLEYAASRGVEVFYVTNRETPVREATIANLQRLGFPNADADHVLTRCLKSDDSACPDSSWAQSDKGTRRAHVARTHRILLLLGDNLGDFLDGVKTSPERRVELYRAHLSYWGERWIMLPNPSYGSWEDALIGNDHGKSAEQKNLEKRAALRTAWPQQCDVRPGGVCMPIVDTEIRP